MNTSIFKFEKYRGPATKVKCPQCGQKTFMRYINSNAGDYVSDITGRCDRENSCGYHYTPKQFFADNPNTKESNAYESNTFGADQIQKPFIDPANAQVRYLPFDLMEKSVELHNRSCLYQFLTRKFTASIAARLCADYFIGTNRNGNTVFWQVDFKGQIRQAKAMQYNPSTGKRNKEFGARFIGKTILKSDDANLKQCFFGEYLLNGYSGPVAIVESEKTAVIASVYFPQYIWLATGGKHGARFTESSVCKVLSGRSVVMFPDVKAYDTWKEKGGLPAAVAGCRVVVSDMLHNLATDQERDEDCDIADYLLRSEDSTGLALTDYKYPVIWDYKN
jgi:hypothetical protein